MDCCRGIGWRRGVIREVDLAKENVRKGQTYSILKHFDFLILDFFCIESAFFLAYQVRFNSFIKLWGKYFFMAGIICVSFLTIVMFWNIYSGILRRTFWSEAKSVFALIAGIFVSLTLYCFISKSTEDYSRAVLLTFFWCTLPITLFVRVLRKESVRKKIKNSQGENLIFIHEKDAERRIAYFTDKAESGLIATGIITYDRCDRKEICGVPIVCCREDFKEYIESHDVNCVFFYLRGTYINEYIDYLVRKKIVVYRVLRNLEKSSYRYSVSEMNGYKTLCIREKEKSLGFVILKRLQDILLSLAALIFTAPITLLTAIAIKLEDGGPVFYVSKRMGQYGKEFNIYKFRSMKLNADKLEDILTPEELERYYKEYKLDNDPRITKVGNFIRKHSIDELPQFINILKGDMAMIGPRPILKKELEENYPDNKDLLLSLKPGLTGYWQAYGRNNVTYQTGERQAMELYYIEHFSGALDMKIILKTIQVVFTAEGAQ